MSIVTKEAILAAKDKYGTIFIVSVSKSEDLTLSENLENDPKEIETLEDFEPSAGEFYAVLRKPSKQEIGLALTHRDPVKMGGSILKNSVVKIDGKELADEEIYFDDDVNISASLSVIELVNLKTSNLKKF